MINLCELFGVTEREKFGVALVGEATVPSSPYYIQNNTLFDRTDRTADDMLGKLLRGKAEVVHSGYKTLMKKKERYFYFDTEMRVQSRVNKGALADIINALTGNMFVDKKKMTGASGLAVQQYKKTLLEPESFEQVRAFIDKLSLHNRRNESPEKLTGVLSSIFQKDINEI